ncbi:uncharacterized protein LOC116657318 [Camelus ferus]|uniref:Uncharacterized protein LOC116657318 n=1 Tax=Camelus ferus TaxID=419612 RepID=A0A8B8RBH5_CAMFR|nr:uncharacterized protein LOC116657318 [Camelus ferus]
MTHAWPDSAAGSGTGVRPGLASEQSAWRKGTPSCRGLPGAVPNLCSESHHRLPPTCTRRGRSQRPVPALVLPKAPPAPPGTAAWPAGPSSARRPGPPTAGRRSGRGAERRSPAGGHRTRAPHLWATLLGECRKVHPPIHNPHPGPQHLRPRHRQLHWLPRADAGLGSGSLTLFPVFHACFGGLGGTEATCSRGSCLAVGPPEKRLPVSPLRVVDLPSGSLGGPAVQPSQEAPLPLPSGRRQTLLKTGREEVRHHTYHHQTEEEAEAQWVDKLPRAGRLQTWASTLAPDHRSTRLGSSGRQDPKLTPPLPTSKAPRWCPGAPDGVLRKQVLLECFLPPGCGGERGHHVLDQRQARPSCSPHSRVEPCVPSLASQREERPWAGPGRAGDRVTAGKKSSSIFTWKAIADHSPQVSCGCVVPPAMNGQNCLRPSSSRGAFSIFSSLPV